MYTFDVISFRGRDQVTDYDKMSKMNVDITDGFNRLISRNWDMIGQNKRSETGWLIHLILNITSQNHGYKDKK